MNYLVGMISYGHRGTSGSSVNNVLHVLHVAHGGGPVLRMLAADADNSSEFIKEHDYCVKEKVALVVEVSDARELVLAPVVSVQGDGTTTKVFWGYVLPPGLPNVVCAMLEKGQLGLIFDLDETLVVAHSVSTIESRVKSCQEARQKLNADLNARIAAGMSSKQDRERTALSIAALQKEEELLVADQDLIRQFMSTDRAKDKEGHVHFARLEPARTAEGALVQRPVVRLENNLVVLTRIDPSNRSTSMIMRIRPGWEELRQYLAGEADGKQRFNVYVCTAAERQYALEVWRLLDRTGVIIPEDDRSKRVVNVPGGGVRAKKTLYNSLGLLPAHSMDNPLQPPTPLAADDDADPGLLPVAVVVDDRLEVWEDASIPHVLQVLPFMYYRDEANRLVRANTNAAALSERELLRVFNAVKQMRGEVYQSIDMVVKPTLDALMATGVPEAQQADGIADVVPPVKSVSQLLRDPAFAGIFGMPKPGSVAPLPLPEDGVAVQLAPGPSPALPVPPAIVPPPQAEVVSLKPKDPRANRAQRALAGAGTQAAAGLGTQPAPGAEMSTRPVDPRHRRGGSVPPSGATQPQPQPAPMQPARAAPVIKNPTAWSLTSLEAMDGDQGADMLPQQPPPPPPRPTAELHAAQPQPAPAAATASEPDAAAPSATPAAGNFIEELMRLIQEGRGEVVQEQVNQFAQTNPPMAQVLYYVIQAVVAEPDLLESACLVVDTCLTRQDVLPRVVAFLAANPGRGIATLAEELGKRKAAQQQPAPAPAAAAVPAVQEEVQATGSVGAQDQELALGPAPGKGPLKREADEGAAQGGRHASGSSDSDSQGGAPRPHKRQHTQHPNYNGGRPNAPEQQLLPQQLPLQVALPDASLDAQTAQAAPMEAGQLPHPTHMHPSQQYYQPSDSSASLQDGQAQQGAFDPRQPAMQGAPHAPSQRFPPDTMTAASRPGFMAAGPTFQPPPPPRRPQQQMQQQVAMQGSTGSTPPPPPPPPPPRRPQQQMQQQVAMQGSTGSAPPPPPPRRPQQQMQQQVTMQGSTGSTPPPPPPPPRTTQPVTAGQLGRELTALGNVLGGMLGGASDGPTGAQQAQQQQPQAQPQAQAQGFRGAPGPPHLLHSQSEPPTSFQQPQAQLAQPQLAPAPQHQQQHQHQHQQQQPGMGMHGMPPQQQQQQQPLMGSMRGVQPQQPGIVPVPGFSTSLQMHMHMPMAPPGMVPGQGPGGGEGAPGPSQPLGGAGDPRGLLQGPVTAPDAWRVLSSLPDWASARCHDRGVYMDRGNLLYVGEVTSGTGEVRAWGLGPDADTAKQVACLQMLKDVGLQVAFPPPVPPAPGYEHQPPNPPPQQMVALPPMPLPHRPPGSAPDGAGGGAGFGVALGQQGQGLAPPPPMQHQQPQQPHLQQQLGQGVGPMPGAPMQGPPQPQQAGPPKQQLQPPPPPRPRELRAVSDCPDVHQAAVQRGLSQQWHDAVVFFLRATGFVGQGVDGLLVGLRPGLVSWAANALGGIGEGAPLAAYTDPLLAQLARSLPPGVPCPSIPGVWAFSSRPDAPGGVELAAQQPGLDSQHMQQPGQSAGLQRSGSQGGGQQGMPLFQPQPQPQLAPLLPPGSMMPPFNPVPQHQHPFQGQQRPQQPNLMPLGVGGGGAPQGLPQGMLPGLPSQGPHAQQPASSMAQMGPLQPQGMPQMHPTLPQAMLQLQQPMFAPGMGRGQGVFPQGGQGGMQQQGGQGGMQQQQGGQGGMQQQQGGMGAPSGGPQGGSMGSGGPAPAPPPPEPLDGGTYIDYGQGDEGEDKAQPGQPKPGKPTRGLLKRLKQESMGNGEQYDTGPDGGGEGKRGHKQVHHKSWGKGQAQAHGREQGSKGREREGRGRDWERERDRERERGRDRERERERDWEQGGSYRKDRAKDSEEEEEYERERSRGRSSKRHVGDAKQGSKVSKVVAEAMAYQTEAYKAPKTSAWLDALEDVEKELGGGAGKASDADDVEEGEIEEGEIE